MIPDINLDIERTADGSVTIYRNDLDEHYHSVKGALAESLHVYLDLGWRHVARHKNVLRVFEVGFGTGLNAAITAAEALRTGIMTEYFTIELNPLPPELTELIAENTEKDYADAVRSVNNAAWDVRVRINEYFVLTKIHGDLLKTDLPDSLDVVYFDAFAPEKQPELWGEGVFRRFHKAMSEGGVLTTYCSKGVIRRCLNSIGFNTERLAGPPAGKREVLRATR